MDLEFKILILPSEILKRIFSWCSRTFYDELLEAAKKREEESVGVSCVK